ncbi:calcium-binding protein, partial [Novosphingobium sp.]|uniref:calcium-binding protein n=1 Tax=Novosphingobium sp. TaxID=1874826 RepID=UPI002629012A
NTLTGNSGNNMLAGLGGSDTLNGGSGNDTLDGGTEIDTATYLGSASGVTVSLALAGAQVTGGAGTDTLIAIENLTGSAFADTLTGNTGNNIIAGLAGNDVLSGGAGNDTLDGGADIDTASYFDAASGVTVSLALAGAQATGGAGSDTLIAIENLTGSAFVDTLTGNTGDNLLIGLAGNDILNGGAGNDTLDGGTDIDTATYLGAASGVTVSLALAGAQVTGGAGTDTLIAIENLSGSALADTLTGSTGNNTLIGLAGNDILSGGLGVDRLEGGDNDDVLIGGVNWDTLIGGTGADRFQFGAAVAANFDRVVDFAIGVDKLAFTAAEYGLVAGSLGAANFTAGAAAIGGTAQFVYDSAIRTLSWDADGAGAITAVRIATFDTAIALAATDFILL